MLPIYIQAQTVDSISNVFIEKLDQFLTVKLSTSNDIKNFKVRNTTTYEINPNDKNIIKLSANYKWLSGSISATPHFLNGQNNDFMKGKTKTTAFAFNFHFSQWTQKFSYTHIKGFYLKNTVDFIPDWRKDIDPYIQFPDLVYNGYYGQTAYSFNKNFSFNALSEQTERQVKSAGTFRPALSYNYDHVENKIILTAQDSSQMSQNFQALLSAGYFHTFVFKNNFYFSIGLNPGIGIISTKFYNRYPTLTIKTNYVNIIYQSEATCAFGFNANKFFIGSQLTATNSMYNQHNISTIITTKSFIYQVFAGYRFGEIKFIKNALSKVEEKMRL